MDKLAINDGKPVRNDFLVYGAPDIGQEEIDEVVDTLKSGWISTGPKAKQFERDVLAYVGGEYAVATNSCTSALHLSLLAYDIGAGDEVITTPMTFGATVNVIEHVGATPILVDIDKNGFNIDPHLIEANISDRTKAIIPVHYAGYPCEMDMINFLAEKYNLIVIEDAAHAMGTKYNEKMIGNSNNCVCFSFYVTKNIAAAEGGMVVCPNKDIYNKIRTYSLHGMNHGAWQRFTKSSKLHYDIVVPGYKYNMPDLNASLGIQQLKKLDNFIYVRRKYASIYFELLRKVNGLILPYCLIDDNSKHICAWHLFPVLLDPTKFSVDREEIMFAIINENIGVATHYRAIFDQEYYRSKYKYSRADFPNASMVSDNVFSIPLSSAMSESDVADVVAALNKVLVYFSD